MLLKRVGAMYNRHITLIFSVKSGGDLSLLSDGCPVMPEASICAKGINAPLTGSAVAGKTECP